MSLSVMRVPLPWTVLSYSIAYFKLVITYAEFVFCIGGY